MDVSPRKRASILTLHENTEKTYWEISKIVGVSISAISRIMKMKKETRARILREDLSSRYLQ